MRGLSDRLLPTPVLGFKGGIDLTQEVLCPLTFATCKIKKSQLILRTLSHSVVLYRPKETVVRAYLASVMWLSEMV